MLYTVTCNLYKWHRWWA